LLSPAIPRVRAAHQPLDPAGGVLLHAGEEVPVNLHGVGR